MWCLNCIQSYETTISFHILFYIGQNMIFLYLLLHFKKRANDESRISNGWPYEKIDWWGWLVAYGKQKKSYIHQRCHKSQDEINV